jgi:diacylglycerol kinase (ATP)
VLSTQKNQPFFRRLGYAVNGLLHGLRTERSVQTQSAALLLVVVALAALRPAPVWWALVLFVSCAVIAAELFNTAIERLADHLHPEQHAAIRIVKDCAAAGVLLVVTGAVLVALALLIDSRNLWLR